MHKPEYLNARYAYLLLRCSLNLMFYWVQGTMQAWTCFFRSIILAINKPNYHEPTQN